MPNTSPVRSEIADGVGDRTAVERPVNEVGNGIGRHAAIEERQRRLREHDAERGAEQADDRRLGQQLPDDAQAAGAKRRANRDLAMADRRAREQQVGDVRARDHQHERHRAHHRQDHELDLLGNHPVSQRPDHGAPALVLVRIGGRETANHAAHIGRRLLDRHAGLHPREHLQGAHIAGGRLEVRRQRHPEALRLREHELRRHDADDRVGKSVDGDRPADDRAIAVVAQLPHLVAEHDDAFGAGTVIVGGEVASERRRRSEKAEERRRDRRAVEALGLRRAVRHRQRPAGKGGQGRERRRLVAHVAEVEPRQPGPVDPGPLVGRVQDDDAVGIRIGERLEQHPVHDAENG